MNKYEKIAIAKGAAQFVVGFSTGSVIKAVINNNVRPETNLEKAETAVGSYVVGGMVADVSKLWIGKRIDDAVIWYNHTIQKYTNS